MAIFLPITWPAIPKIINIKIYQKEKPAERRKIAATGIGAWIDKNHIRLYDVNLLLSIPKGRFIKKQIIPILKIKKNSS